MATRPVRKPVMVEHPQCYFVKTTADFDPAGKLKVVHVPNQVAEHTMRDMSLAWHVTSPTSFPLTLLIQPVDLRRLAGIETASIHMFYWGSGSPQSAQKLA